MMKRRHKLQQKTNLDGGGRLISPFYQVQNLRKNVTVATKLFKLLTLGSFGKDCFQHVKFEVFTEVTMKNAVFWNIKIKFVLHMRHVTSELEPSRLMLCQISGSHGGDNEECRLLAYKNPVRTSQEAH
jgi:hypothetical protein